VTNGHDINEPLIVINAVENSVVADPYSPEITAALQLTTARGPRLNGQFFNPG
jgi:hypothetical protein